MSIEGQGHFLTLAQGHLCMKIKTGKRGTSGSILMKLGMKHHRFKLIIFCSNYNTVLILTYFTASSNFATLAFIWENVTIMDTLEIIASCDLEFGLLCKLND